MMYTYATRPLSVFAISYSCPVCRVLKSASLGSQTSRVSLKRFSYSFPNWSLKSNVRKCHPNFEECHRNGCGGDPHARMQDSHKLRNFS